MGMFDKDKEFGTRLDQVIAIGESFVVFGAVVRPDTISTSLGDAEVAELEIGKLADDGVSVAERMTANTVASAIVNKVKEAEDSDFPAIVKLLKVDSKWGKKATVIQFVRPA
jgi:hypothetical protein